MASEETGRFTSPTTSTSAHPFTLPRLKTIGQQLQTLRVPQDHDHRDIASLPRIKHGNRQFVLDSWIQRGPGGRTSDVQRLGYSIREVINNELRARFWVCQQCDGQGTVVLFDTTNATSAVWAHLTKRHKMVRDGKRAYGIEAGQTTLSSLAKRPRVII